MSKASGIGIDGYNLALREGTGVSTYGRTLVRAAKARGYETCGIYGLRIPKVPSPAIREVLFFGALGEEPRPAARGFRRLLRQSLLLPLPREAQQIPLTGEVVMTGFEDRVPSFDRLFNFGNLFAIGMRYFRCYGRFLPLRVTAPPAIMHWTYPLPVRLLGSQNIYTIHDLVPLRLPYTSTEDKRYHHRLLQHCIGTGRIVTVSENSRTDILRQFPGTDPAAVVNTYQAVLPETSLQRLTPDELGQRLETLFGLKAGGYFLFFGATEPKKNIGRLLEAYISSGTPTPLMMVSGGGWRAKGELRLLDGVDGRGSGTAQQVRRLSYLPRALLMLLVRGARAVLLPSIYEGFGLPVLEAMALGVPVLTANGHAVAEVSADAALQVDPYSVHDLREGIIRLDNDDDLRRRLAAAGPERAAFFSMTRYEERIHALYQGLLEAGPKVKGAP